jgi:large subunit ribosomal protein L3
MTGLIGKKIGSTRVYDENGAAIGVTVVEAGPNYVLQCKTVEKDGYSAVQLGFDEQKEQRLTRPAAGHARKHGGVFVKRIKEFRDFGKEVNTGDQINVDLFAAGDYIDAIGITKGKGFQGVMRRFGFGGGPGSHGAKGFSRRPGAIGAGSTPGTVDKGTKLPGHMGQRRRTTQNLKVIQVRAEDNLLLIQGSIPGANGDYVVIRESKKRGNKR